MTERYTTPPVTNSSRTEATVASRVVVDSSKGAASDQKLMDPSPFRPHTTMAIEKVNVAARAAQPRVISTGRCIELPDCTETIPA